jgi:hypothetical protein
MLVEAVVEVVLLEEPAEVVLAELVDRMLSQQAGRQILVLEEAVLLLMLRVALEQTVS